MEVTETSTHKSRVKHTLSVSGRSKTHSGIPVRKITETDSPKLGARITIKSLNDLDSLTEDFFELLPQVNIVSNLATEDESGDKTNVMVNRPTHFKRRSKSFNEKMNTQIDRRENHGSCKFKDNLSSTSTSIDSLTTNKKETLKIANTKRPAAIPRSKTTHSLYENQNRMLGVQLKRCLSLYDRKRTPHFCANHTLSEKDETVPSLDYTSVKSGPVALANTMKKDKAPIKRSRSSSMKAEVKKTDRPRSQSERSEADRLTPDRLRTNRAIDMLLERGDDTDITSTITSGSAMSSTLSLESGGSSELDFDALVQSQESGKKSPHRLSMIPKPIRPRSATLCLMGNGMSRERQDNEAFNQAEGRKVKRSVSLYERKVSSFSDGSTSVSIRIRETVRADSGQASASSSYSSLDDVFSRSSGSSKLKSVEVPEDEDSYPEPVPPANSRSDVFNPREYIQVDQHALKAPNSLSTSFDDLIGYLLEDLTSDLSKVRAIYRWVVSQTIPLTLSRHDVVDDSPLGFLYNIRERRASYSELMAVLCRKAGIHCVIIHGMAKSVAYDVGDKVTHKKMRNSWNAVYVDGSWRFIHPYWASQSARGYTTGRWAVIESDAFHTEDQSESSQQVAQKLNDFFFLTDPEKFITKCFPDDSQWQLLRHHLTKHDFEALPFLQPAFYELKLKVRSHDCCIIHTDNGKQELSLAMPKDKAKIYKFRYKLYVHRDWEAEGEYDPILLERYLLYYHEGNIANFEIRFPVSGVYKLELHCSDPNKPLPSDWVCDYKIVCNKPMDVCNPLPIVPSIGWGPGLELTNAGLECLTHDNGVVSLDKEAVTFVRFALPKDGDVTVEAELMNNDKLHTELQDHVSCEQDGESATIQISPPSEGEYALRVFTVPKSTGKRKNVCNFLMERTQIIEDPELSDIRQSLVKATEDGDVETLAYWVDKFVEKGMADKGDLTTAKKKLRLSKLNRDIAEAIARKDLDLLERTMNSLSGTSMKRQLGNLASDAEAMRSRLRRLKRLKHAVLEMDQKTISEMRSYPKPPQAVHGVMAATFLLLGNKEQDLKKWSRVQGLISKRGKEGLKRRVGEFDSSRVTPAVLKRAKAILDKYDLESIQIASAGAAVFYQWAIHMVAEVENDLEKVY